MLPANVGEVLFSLKCFTALIVLLLSSQVLPNGRKERRDLEINSGSSSNGCAGDVQ